MWLELPCVRVTLEHHQRHVCRRHQRRLVLLLAKEQLRLARGLARAEQGGLPGGRRADHECGEVVGDAGHANGRCGDRVHGVAPQLLAAAALDDIHYHFVARVTARPDFRHRLSLVLARDGALPLEKDVEAVGRAVALEEDGVSGDTLVAHETAQLAVRDQRQLPAVLKVGGALHQPLEVLLGSLVRLLGARAVVFGRLADRVEGVLAEREEGPLRKLEHLDGRLGRVVHALPTNRRTHRRIPSTPRRLIEQRCLSHEGSDRQSRDDALLGLDVALLGRGLRSEHDVALAVRDDEAAVRHVTLQHHVLARMEPHPLQHEVEALQGLVAPLGEEPRLAQHCDGCEHPLLLAFPHDPLVVGSRHPQHRAAAQRRPRCVVNLLLAAGDSEVTN